MSLQLRGTEGIQFNDGSDQSTAATPYGRKNLIINGDMRIAQRGTSATGLTVGGYKTVDRWNTTIGNAGTWTQTQDTDVPSGQGFSKSLKMQCTTANASLVSGSALAIDTRFEGQNLQHLKKGTVNAQSLTFSFWVKSNKTGTYIAEMYDTDNTRQISKTYTINTADTWEKKTLTFIGDTSGVLDDDNNLSLIPFFWLAAGTDFSGGTLNTSWASAVNANRVVGQVNLADSTSNYINITGVQLEVGDAASDFEFMPYDMELARCQRYYYRLTGGEPYFNVGGSFAAVSSNTALGAIQLPVTMRTQPTGITVSGTFVFSATGINPTITIDSNTSHKNAVGLGATATGSLALYRAYSLISNNNSSNYIEVTGTEL